MPKKKLKQKTGKCRGRTFSLSGLFGLEDPVLPGFGISSKDAEQKISILQELERLEEERIQIEWHDPSL